MEQKTKRLYAFGAFRLDAGEFLLTVDGKTLPLPPKAFESLLILVENAGHLVDKNELTRRLWPDTFVEDGNLAKHVSLLRKILSEASNGQEYIETIPKRGYRFVAKVAVPADSAPNSVRPESHIANFEDVEVREADSETAFTRTKRFTPGMGFAAVTFFLLTVSAVVVWVRMHQAPSAPDIQFRQITASSSEDPIRYGAISPDGKYLAYADLKGIHIMLIKTGEAQTVPQPESLRGSRVDWQFFRWFPDGTRFLVNQNPPDERSYGYSATIWSVSAVGGPPRKLRQDAGVESISPDGSLVAFTTDTQNAWLMDPNGEQVKKIFTSAPDKTNWNFRFSPNGERLLDTQYPDGPLESRDLHGGNLVTILSGMGDRLRDYIWLRDGRVVYSLREPSPNVNTCNLWDIRVDARTFRPEGNPQRLTNWVGTCAENLSATADGKTIAFQQWTDHETVFVANVEADRTHITAPVRLTVNDTRSIPTAWREDSKSVVFKSSFNGETGLYEQHLEQDISAQMVTGAGDLFDHTPVTPDGAWILYDAPPSPRTDNQLMRTPVAGGPPQAVLAGADRGVRCTRSPYMLCVMAEGGLGPSFTFSEFDPLKGRGPEIAKISIDPESDFFWDLSPEGHHIAVLEGQTGRIHILSLTGEAAREINTKGLESTQFINWGADGKAVFVSRPTQRGFELLRVNLGGKSEVLWEERGGLGISALPSPDGKHIAIRGWSVTSNFWTMTNF